MSNKIKATFDYSGMVPGEDGKMGQNFSCSSCGFTVPPCVVFKPKVNADPPKNCVDINKRNKILLEEAQQQEVAA